MPTPSTAASADSVGGGLSASRRRVPGSSGQPPHGACTGDGDCTGLGDPCVLYAFEARTPVPLEGLVQTSDVFAFVSDVEADQRMEIDRMSAMLVNVKEQH